MRKILNPNQIDATANSKIENYYSSYVNEAEDAIKSTKFVVIGMAQNPFVAKACKFLKQKKIIFKYIEHGSYFSMWRPRLAIKLWSGWPTFPMIFIDGKLIGGFQELIKWFEKN